MNMKKQWIKKEIRHIWIAVTTLFFCISIMSAGEIAALRNRVLKEIAEIRKELPKVNQHTHIYHNGKVRTSSSP